MKKKTVLFVCTHNSARSQMAEGYLRAHYGDRYEARSAGTEPGGVHPLAVRVMREIDVDLADHESEHVDVHTHSPVDYVVTVCDAAHERCPYVPASELIIHQSFEDPSAASGTEDEKVITFRRTRDEIAAWIDRTFSDEPAWSS
jgi:arsenate reductase